MNKPPVFLKIISMISMLSAIVGLIMAFIIPGNIAYVPLFFALIFGLISIIISRKLKAKCFGGYIASAIVVIGLIISLIKQSQEATIATDQKQMERLEETNSEIIDGDELDEALDDLD